MRSIRVHAPAKINVRLDVLGRRTDGYHDIETLFQAIDLQDELIIRESATGSNFEVPGRPELENENNLVIRAVRALEAESARPFHVNVTLLKRIPIAAGLGGGSSDAAAALIGLAALYGQNIDSARLTAVASRLGADVPFFLTGGSAVGEGIGDRLTPVSVCFNGIIFLAHPRFPIGTAAVYREYSRLLTHPRRKGKLIGLIESTRDVQELLHNDLQVAAETLCPEIGLLANRFRELGIAKPLMSGSGPTVFGITDEATADKARSALGRDVDCYITRPISRGVIID